MQKQCFYPFFVPDGDSKPVLIPCGKCEICKRKRISSWSFRLMEELKTSISANFITLTYEDHSQPISDNGYRTLRKRDVQLFFKRLRRLQRKVAGRKAKAIKYFYVGEYGGKVGRPHYHCIIFNADYRQYQKAWSHGKWICNLKTKKSRGNKLRYEITSQRVWRDNGYIHYGNKQGVCEASVGYCLKYILKPKDNRKNPADDSVKEFVNMSKGLGIGYLNGKMMRWHHADLKNRMYVNLPNGKKATMPRYYKDRLYNKKERKAIGEHNKNQFVEELLADLFRHYTEDLDFVDSYQFRKQQRQEQAKAADVRQQHLIKQKPKLCYQ